MLIAIVGNPDDSIRHIGTLMQATQVTAGSCPAPVSLLEDLLDSQTAAALLGIHPKTLERAARAGEVPAFFKFRRWYYSKTQLDAWLRDTLRSRSPRPAPEQEN